MKYKILIDPHRFLKPVQAWLQERHNVEFITLNEALAQYKNKYGSESFKSFQHLSVTDKYISKFPSWFNININTLENIVSQSIDKHVFACAPFIKAMDAYLQNEDISLIMLWNDVAANTKSLTFLGKKYNVPTLHLMHGGLAAAYPVHMNIWSDKLAVFGENTRQLYLDNGNSDEKIVITGNPYWDNWGPCANGEEYVLKKKIGMDTHKKKIMFAPTWYNNQYSDEDPEILEKRDFAIVIDALKTLGNLDKIELLVKIHPGLKHKYAIYNKELEESPVPYRIFAQISPLQVIQASDVVICSGSMIFESLLVGKPSVLFKPGISPLEFNFFNYQVTADNAPFYVALSKKQLSEALSRALAGSDAFLKKDIDDYLYKSIGPRDGKAAERVGNLAMEMITGKRKKEFISPFSYKKRELYYVNVRQDIPSMIDAFPQKILEVGCAEGGMGELIKKTWGCEYVGLDINSKAAYKAKKKLDQVIVADVEKTDLRKNGVRAKSLDYIIYGDVLEHLYDPWSVLHEHKKFLKDDGYLIASIPNIRNLEVINFLVNGKWTYKDEGILDSTHLRFFTLHEIRKMFTKCGYSIIKVNSVTDRLFNLDEIKGPKSIDLPKLIIKNVSKEEALEFLTVQFVVKAKKAMMTQSVKELQCQLNVKSPMRKKLFKIEK